ncbi:hypothetical protein [Neobacillus ginsengisoli]|uniref:Uncharacterized protein n=1 Tax=Neobacillus ginsengisoli TaxID=904295 RepID=A0ABT9Y085_9BACI|nr:hypothetical protein [Neobacillus ginsengisoli]MDQ0201246.1 hypothetical protein [Neobacillus ginsengisoli]
MVGTSQTPDVASIMLSIVWIWNFFDQKQKRTVNFVHIMLLVFGLVILLTSIYKWVNSLAL